MTGHPADSLVDPKDLTVDLARIHMLENDTMAHQALQLFYQNCGPARLFSPVPPGPVRLPTQSDLGGS